MLIFSLFSFPQNVNAYVNYWSQPVKSNSTEHKNKAKPSLGYQPDNCGLCHIKQSKQWQKSLHASSVSPGLLGQLELFDKETSLSCLNCHAPRDRQQKAILEDSSTSVKGVDCAVCHMRQQQHYGPKEINLSAHGTVKAEPLFLSSKFCAGCHQFGDDAIVVNGKPLENTLTEWQSSRYFKQGISCQNCHMPAGEHSFKGVHDVDMVRQGLSVKASLKNQILTVTLHNSGAGHALPTYITPRIRIVWKAEHAKPKTIAVIQRKMDWNSQQGWIELFDTRLQVDEIRQIKTNTATNLTGNLEVWVDPDADYAERVYPVILQALVEESATEASLNQIKRAQSIAKNSSFLVYQFSCKSTEVSCKLLP